MKNTSNRHVGADEQDCALRPHKQTPGAGEGGSREREISRAYPYLPSAVAAVALLAVLGTVPPPAAEAATCTALQRGTLSGSTFTPSSTGSDYYTVCTGDADGQGVYSDHLESATDQSGAATVDPNDRSARANSCLGLSRRLTSS